ncbi:cell division protein ZipA [Shewanella indica]|uniref:cell division protein ZipA n=1 Tax=Shewanella indica TaxID=768528 RepID=UPI003003D13F
MEDLQLVLSVLGAIAIIAVLVHGFWSIRKQQPKSLKENPLTGFYKDQARRDSEGFDADGIGEVRVRKVSPDEKPPKLKSSKLRKPGFQSPQADESESEQAFSLSGAKPEPRVNSKSQRQEPVLHLDDDQDTAEMQMELGLGADAQTDNAHSTVEAEHQENSQPEPQLATEQQTREQAKEESRHDELPDPTDVLVLHVVAKEGESLSGAELLPCLLALNFKFGDMNIFHRHEDNAGTGRVLFSLANMVKPGVFDPDNMEQFSTQGVVLFMTLPCHGDPLMNFSIMLNSAHQLADDLGAELLDGQRQPWHQDTKQAYLGRIRAQG